MPSPASLFGLLYESRSTGAPSPEALQNLLSEAQARNERLGVTGWLTFVSDLDNQGGTFRQYIEGPEPVVRRLFYGTPTPELPEGPSILSDERHTEVRVLQEGAFGGGPPGGRLHPRWAMHWVEMPAAPMAN